ncbi:MAG: hypothetical protein ACN6Q8_00735, partial [Stenotrophomonas sp.]
AKSTPMVIVRIGNSSSRHTDGESHHGPSRPSGYPQGWGVSFLLIQAKLASRVGLIPELGLMDKTLQYWIHNGYSGWSYGTPSDPQLITIEDAARIMIATGLTSDQVSFACPAAQYAETGEHLFRLTGENRFLFYGSLAECMDINPEKVAIPLTIEWAEA